MEEIFVSCRGRHKRRLDSSALPQMCHTDHTVPYIADHQCKDVINDNGDLHVHPDLDAGSTYIDYFEKSLRIIGLACRKGLS